MSRYPQSTAATTPLQPAALLDEWQSRIVPLLPSELATQAHTLGAFQRRRAFETPADLLRGLLAYSLGTSSFRQLGAWGVLTDLADISAKSWHKRLVQANPWLQWLLQQLVHRQIHQRWLSQRVQGRIKLIDATMLARQGGTSAGWRVHTAYDLCAGRLAQVAVTDHYGAESLLHYHLEKGDLLVADGGYGTRAAVGVAQSVQTDVVVRIHLNSFPLEQADGQPFDTLAWLKQPGHDQRSVVAWCTATRTVEGKVIVSRHQVRVVASRLPAPARAAGERRLRRNASQHGRQVSERGLFLASWVLLVTTLARDSWSDDEVRQLYRARWQIELLFKRIKQLLRVHTIRCTTAASATATICALLVTWVLVEQMKGALTAQLQQQATQVEPGNQEQVEVRVLSRWTLSALTLATLRQIVVGRWTLAQLEACLPRLRRFVMQRSPHRRSQADTIERWLNGVSSLISS